MKKRLAYLTAALIAAIGLVPAPAPATEVNQLAAPGTSGKVRILAMGERVRAAGAGFVVQTGDGTDPASNPNRTVGDVAPPPPLGNGRPCMPNDLIDCFRVLMNNDHRLNPNTPPNEPDYMPGDTWLVVNEVKRFLVGDTILIGSPYCNAKFLSESCSRYVPGIGQVDEQPRGEIAHIVGGTVGPSYNGVGVIQLSAGLRHRHRPGTQIVKLPTAYVGMGLQATVSNRDLLEGSSAPPVLPLSVTAYFIPPIGSRRPWDPDVRRPLYKSWTERNVFTQHVHGFDGETSFFIPREVTSAPTIGRTFDGESEDTWYTVDIVARDATGRIVADGMTRFKLNEIVVTGLRPSPPRIKQGDIVEVLGWVSDASSHAALGRHIEDIKVEVTIRTPGSSRPTVIRTHSCFDNEPGPKDRCGTGAGGTFNGHGGFKVQRGGFRCADDTLTTQCRSTYNKRNETATVGTYLVTANVRYILPRPPEATTSFEVQPVLIGNSTLGI